MVGVDLSGKTALITGGTKGIGLASALALAEAGARVFLTYKWGSVDLAELAGKFEALGAPPPGFHQADAAEERDTERLMEELGGSTQGIDIFVSNVSFALRTQSLEDYKKRSLFKTLEYSTWPLIDYTRRIKARFGRYPRYVVGISSDGPDHFYKGYDFVAAAKALLEFFSRYLSVHLLRRGIQGERAALRHRRHRVLPGHLRPGVLLLHTEAGRRRRDDPPAPGLRQGRAGPVQRVAGRGQRPDHQR